MEMEDVQVKKTRKKTNETNPVEQKALLVKNISDKVIYLESGKLMPGASLVATPAEYSSFANLFEVV